MRFLHISDLHLGKTFTSSRYGQDFARRRRQELLDTFERVVDYANQQQVDFILSCGDFLNSEELRMEELRNINAIIKKLNHTVIIAISGNHDPQCEDGAYDRIQWDRRLYLLPPGTGRVALSNLNTTITFHSWDKKEMSEPVQIPQPLAQDGQFQILMLHADVLSPKSRYLPMDAQKLSEAGFHYVALGHIHKMQQPAENVYYSGSLEPLDASETGEHGFIQVDVEEDRTTAQFVPFSSREYRNSVLETSGEDSEKQIVQKIEQEIFDKNRQHIYTIMLRGTHPARGQWDVELIGEELREKNYLCTVEDATRPDYDLQELRRENQGNLIGDFIASFDGRKLTEVEEKALQYGLEALIAQSKED